MLFRSTCLALAVGFLRAPVLVGQVSDVSEGSSGVLICHTTFTAAPGGDGWGDDPATRDVDERANDDFGYLRLGPGSPAIDSGDNEAVPPDVTTDLDGNPRNVPGTIDMGAYEHADCNS